MFKLSTTQFKRIGLVSLLAFMVLSACAPALKSKSFPEPVSEFGPRNRDAEIKIDHIKIENSAASSLSFERDMTSSEYFIAAEHILRLSKRSHPELENLGHNLIEGFYKSNVTTTRSPFSKSPFLLAAIGETQADAKDAIFNVVKMLDDQAALVQSVVEKSKTEYNWPGNEIKVDQLVDFVETYISSLEQQWKRAKLDPRVYKGLLDGIKEQFDPLAAKIRIALTAMSLETNLARFIAELNQVAGYLDVELDKDTKELLQKGLTLGSLVDSAVSENDGLRVIVAVWRLLEPAERKKQFEAMSPALYKFLNGASDGQLDCLEGKRCGLDIYTILARNSQILPQIKTYGVDKLKDQVNQGAVQYASASLIQQVAPLLKAKLPDIFEERIAKSFKDEAQVLAGISKDFKAFLSPGVDKWAKTYYQEKPIGISALELTDVHVKFTSSKNLSFGKLKSQTVGAATLGASMTALETRWELQQERFSHIPLETSTNKIIKMMPSKLGPEQLHVQEILSQINKALSIGGFRVNVNERFKSLSFALNPDGKSDPNLDLKSVFENPISFVVPDALIATDAFHAVPADKDRLNVDIESQAQLLKGLSRMVYFFRDWESNSFDRLLGNIKVNDFVLDPRMKSIDQKFFPKDILFTLFIGDAAVILSNFAKSMSTILLLDENRNMKWENEADNGDPSAPISAMAAFANIVNGKRSEIADSTALSHELLALVEFYNATEGIEKTNSVFLTQKMKDGSNTLDALRDGRKKVFLLTSAIANFLTHEMQDPDGGVYHNYDMIKKMPVKGPRNLRDQVNVMAALEKAGSMNSALIYKNAALDVYYFINRKLWNAEKGFYLTTEGGTSIGQLPEIVETLNLVESITSLMPNDSILQWKKISQPWLNALKQL